MNAEASLPDDIVWQERPFPDANFLLLRGDRPALIDSGFAAHAEMTQGLARDHSARLDYVVNTHWHSDHVGANGLLQQAGARILASRHDADALSRADPACCAAEYLDQPVPHYTVDHAVTGGDRLVLGTSEWEVLAVPGHTPGDIALWDAEHRVAIVGDTVTSYDVGWVDIMRQGTHALDTMHGSLENLRNLDARLLLPGHGPLVTDPLAAVEKALGRVQRQRSHLDIAINYGTKRILAFGLMIRGGMGTSALESYLPTCDWAIDAAGMLGEGVEDFTNDLVDSMLTSGALKLRNGTVYAAAEHTAVDPKVFQLPLPRHWPVATDTSQ